MKKRLLYILSILAIVSMLLCGCGKTNVNTGDLSGNQTTQSVSNNDNSDSKESGIVKSGSYTSKDEVASYIKKYGCLPSNFITKTEAQKLGWDSSKGNLSNVAPGKSIGGDRFGNYEKKLPVKQGRTYYECDINSDGSYRNAERIIYSNDGLIYYTNDHYETFTLLYGNE